MRDMVCLNTHTRTHVCDIFSDQGNLPSTNNYPETYHMLMFKLLYQSISKQLNPFVRCWPFHLCGPWDILATSVVTDFTKSSGCKNYDPSTISYRLNQLM